MKKIVGMALIIVVGLFVVACAPRDSADYINDSEKESVVGETDTENSTEAVDGHTLDTLLMAQNLVVVDVSYALSSSDTVGAVLQNNTDSEIKDVVIGYVAWDENNNPVKFWSGDYIKEVDNRDVQINPKGVFGVFEDINGFVKPEDNTITQFRAIAVSYVTIEGDSWENPYYSEFKQLYEGKKLQ